MEPLGDALVVGLAPRIVDRAAVAAAYSPSLRLALRLFGIRRFLVVTRV